MRGTPPLVSLRASSPASANPNWSRLGNAIRFVALPRPLEPDQSHHPFAAPWQSIGTDRRLLCRTGAPDLWARTRQLTCYLIPPPTSRC